MSSTMLLGILLKIQQFIHYNKVAIQVYNFIMQSYKYMCDSYDLLHLPFLQNLYVSGKIVYLVYFTYNAALVKSVAIYKFCPTES